MTRDVLEWWGFQLRFPPGYVPKPVSAVERVLLAALAGAALTGAWLCALVFWPVEAGFSARVLVPLLLFAIPAAPALLLPELILERSGIATWVALSREKGGIRGWDRWMDLLAVGSVIAAVFHVTPPLRAAVILMLLEVALASITLALQESVHFTGWRWTIEVPDWLREIVEERKRRSVESDEVIGTDPDADPVSSSR